MIRRRFLLLTIAGVALLTVAPLVSVIAQAPQGATAGVPRAIRRDVPMTNAIRRAWDAGTRDATGRPGPNYWQLQTDYTIRVRLDPATHTLTGTETITLHNNSPQPLPNIFLRLDHNIFRGLVPRGGSVPAENTDGMVITQMSINGAAIDISAGPTGPGRAIGLNQTLARVIPASPIAAKSQAKIDISWTTKLPGGPGQGHRMTQRWDDNVFQPTQWYPRIAKYDDLRGWDTNVYLGPSEFYNNFGRFDVRIDVPSGWIVSGTGVLQNPGEVLTAEAQGRLKRVLDSDEVITIVGEKEVKTATFPAKTFAWHFIADMVNDFAWATSKNYVWRATRATIPGKGPVPIHMLHLPEREKFYANAGPITRHALEFYSKLWAPYPFPQLTLQDGPSAGMEYPMVINSNQGAADHETGHQWWPMMVGNNETWYGWMDEGFNQYMNILSNADAGKRAPNLNRVGQQYGEISGNENEPPMMWNANYGGDMYGFQTYSKTPMMLSMLGGIVGDTEVQRAMSEYTKVWAFKHPSPWDYIFFMNSQLKQDLNWFWYYWLWTTESVEGSIENVTTSGSRTTVTVKQAGQMPSPVVLKVQFAADGPAIKPMANAKIVDATSAIVTWPVDVWFNGSRTYQAVLDFGGRAITTITLDPACRFPDRNVSDNAWPRQAAAAPAAGRGGAAPGSSCGG
jgi:hypothetical protein